VIDKSKPLAVAVVGCGRISASHLDAIAACPDQARLVAVVDADADRAASVAQRYGALQHFEDLAKALALPSLEAVLICTPNEMHTAQTLQALAAGKHVLVEKPMAENCAAAEAMADAASRTGRILAIGHTFRHSAPVRYLQDHRAQFGTLRAIEVSQCVFWDGPQAPWWATRPADQGLILSLFAPHALDFVQLVMADDPLRVHVEAARHQSGWLGEDEAMIVLAYPSRRMASLHLSYNQRQVVDRKTLFFDQGVLRIEDGEYLYWNDATLVAPDPAVITDSRSMGGRDLSGHFQTQLREFVHAVRGQSHRSVLHEEGRRLIALMDRVRAASRKNSADMIDDPA
jgi:UDP-N-acetyl-2-amino-2-deoxyglucuronate dehydrogenase